MFERQTLGDGYWKKLAANKPVLYPSGAPTASGIIRGEVLLRGVQSNAVSPEIKKGDPLKVIYLTEGIPVTASAETGRASWSERVCEYVEITVVALTEKKKDT